MKKNLSKNTVKSMAIGLAIAMGSSVAISGISGNLVEATASGSITNPDLATTPIEANKYIFQGDLLFKVTSVDTPNSTGKAAFIGKATIPASVTGDADGTNKPFKASSLTEGVLLVNGKTESKNYRITVDNIGTGEALKNYTFSGTTNPTPAELNTLTITEVNSVLAKATTIKAKAFDKISITGTNSTDKLILPKTLTTVESKAFGGIATANTDNPVYINAKAISNFTAFNAESFDKDAAAALRTVNVELANHTDKKEFDKIFTSKTNVKSTEKEAPKIISAEYAGKNEVILNASEELKESNQLETFTITKKESGSRSAIIVSNAKVEGSEKTKIKLTLDKAIDENGTYSVQYEEKTSKEVKDESDNKLASPTTLEFNVDRTAPTVTSVEVSNDEKNKVVITFDKEVKQKAEGKLKEMFTVKKTSQSDAVIEIKEAQIKENTKKENTKIELTLNQNVVYGDTLTVSYKSNNDNNLQNKLGVDVQNFENKEVTNNVNLALQENDTIDAGGYTFKVLSGNTTVALTGKKSTGRVARAVHNNGTVTEGVVSIGGNKVNVTEIGDGTKALDGDNFNVAELNNIIPNVTKIGAKAFDGKTLDGSTKISFPKVTNVGANGLGIKAGCEIVELPAVESSVASQVDAVAFKSTSGTSSVTKLKVQEGVKETLKDKFSGVTVDKSVTAPTVGQTINMDKFQFTILTKDEDETEGTVGTVKLTKLQENNVSSSTSQLTGVKLQNGVLSGQKDNETFKYNFTEIDIKEGKDKLNADEFKKLDISKVTKIAANSFEGATLPDEVTFPAVVELEANSFKGVKGLTTLTLPELKVLESSKINNQAFGNNAENATSVTTLKLHEGAAYTFLNYFENKNVKVKPIQTSKGTANDVVILGKKGDSLSYDIVIKIENEYFATDLNDVTHWFTNLPAGLTAKVKDGQGSKLKQVTVTISGTPTALSSGKVSIKIPSKNLTFGTDILVDTNAKFDITEKPSTGGGSSSGSYSQSGSVSLGNKDKTVTSENTSEGTTAENKNKTTTDTNIEFKDLKIDEINLPTITGSAANFSDVPATHWASESIGKLSSAGIIKGVPGGGFNANGNSKRADVAIMLTRLLGLENKTSTARFSDVSPNAYYANAVGVAKEYGIINGNADGTFNPESYISRQDTMVMISRILDNLNVSTNADTTVLAQFSDTANISSYALEATSKLVNLGIINGNEGKINPKYAITRAEMAVIMDRVYGIIDKKVKEEAAKETTTETTTSKDGSTTTTETTTSKDGSTTTTESTSTTETTTSKQ